MTVTVAFRISVRPGRDTPVQVSGTHQPCSGLAMHTYVAPTAVVPLVWNARAFPLRPRLSIDSRRVPHALPRRSRDLGRAARAGDLDGVGVRFPALLVGLGTSSVPALLPHGKRRRV